MFYGKSLSANLRNTLDNQAAFSNHPWCNFSVWLNVWMQFLCGSNACVLSNDNNRFFSEKWLLCLILLCVMKRAIIFRSLSVRTDVWRVQFFLYPIVAPGQRLWWFFAVKAVWFNSNNYKMIQCVTSQHKSDIQIARNMDIYLNAFHNNGLCQKCSKTTLLHIGLAVHLRITRSIWFVWNSKETNE